MTRVLTAVFNPISIRLRPEEPVSVVNKSQDTRLQTHSATDECPISAVGLKLNCRVEKIGKKLSKRNCRDTAFADEVCPNININSHSANSCHRTKYSGNTDSLAYRYIQRHIDQATSSNSPIADVPKVQNNTPRQRVCGLNEPGNYSDADEGIAHSFNHESSSDSEGSFSINNESRNISEYFLKDDDIHQHITYKQSYVLEEMIKLKAPMTSMPCDGRNLLKQKCIHDDQSSHEIKSDVNVEEAEQQNVRRHGGRKKKSKSKSRSRKGKKEAQHSKSNKYRASSETETHRSKISKARCLSGNARQQVPEKLTNFGTDMFCTGVKVTRVPPLNSCNATFYSQNPIPQFREEIDTNRQLLSRFGSSKSAEQYVYKFAKHQQYFNDKSHWRLKPRDNIPVAIDAMQNMKLEPLNGVYENVAHWKLNSVNNPHCDSLSDSVENDQRLSELKRAITEMQISERCSNVPISHSLPGSPGHMSFYNIRTKSGTLNLPRQTKVYLSEKQSGSIQECGGNCPCAPPATPTTFQLERYQYIPSMNDIKSQRSVRMRLEVLEMAAQRHKEKQKKQQALQEKQQARVKLREQKNQQRREIYALNKLMTELENGRFEAFCMENGIDPT